MYDRPTRPPPHLLSVWQHAARIAAMFGASPGQLDAASATSSTLLGTASAGDSTMAQIGGTQPRLSSTSSGSSHGAHGSSGDASASASAATPRPPPLTVSSRLAMAARLETMAASGGAIYGGVKGGSHATDGASTLSGTVRSMHLTLLCLQACLLVALTRAPSHCLVWLADAWLQGPVAACERIVTLQDDRGLRFTSITTHISTDVAW